jgi:hypothetical protein
MPDLPFRFCPHQRASDGKRRPLGHAHALKSAQHQPGGVALR